MPQRADYSPPDDPKDRTFVTALARGLDILRCFRLGEVELSNNDFSERTGLPKATVSRLTYTLVKLQYLVSDTQKGTYRLGVGVLQLGFGVLSGTDIVQRAEADMRALRNGPNSYITVALGERQGLDVLYIAVRRSREEVALTMRIGSRLPLFHSAIGRSILVGMDAAEREEVMAEALSCDPDRHVERTDILTRALTEYAEQGYCTGYGDWRPDVNGVAVPVYSLDGSRVHGLNVGGPSFHVKKGQLERVYAPMLRSVADRLGACLLPGDSESRR